MLDNEQRTGRSLPDTGHLNKDRGEIIGGLMVQSSILMTSVGRQPQQLHEHTYGACDTECHGGNSDGSGTQDLWRFPAWRGGGAVSLKQWIH